MIPNSIVKCWKKCLFFGLKVAMKILVKGSAKMKSTSTPPTNELPKTLGQWVVASFEVEQSITTGNQAPRLRHATHHLCTRPTSPPQLSLSLSLFLSTETPLWPTPCAHTHFFTFTFASSCDQSPLCPITLLLTHLEKGSRKKLFFWARNKLGGRRGEGLSQFVLRIFHSEWIDWNFTFNFGFGEETNPAFEGPNHELNYSLFPL